MSNGNSYGGDLQYGTVDPKQFPNLQSRYRINACTG
jgi:hypothetical protein